MYIGGGAGIVHCTLSVVSAYNSPFRSTILFGSEYQSVQAKSVYHLKYSREIVTLQTRATDA
jgi:hypothetical protein